MARTRAEMMELEGLLDKMGVASLVEALGDIASEKEQHVLEAWQDRNLARRWRTLANKFSNLAAKIDDPYFQ